MKNKKFLFDFALNLASTLIPLLLLQTLILPKLGNNIGEDRFGVIVTLISLTTIVSVPIGNVLNNVRLIRNSHYLNKGYEGDFNIILIIGTIINFIVVLVFGLVYGQVGLDLLLLIVMSTLLTLRYYYNVSFRINLNFKFILIENILLSIGYTIGLLLFYIGGSWHLIYIIGNLLSLIFILSVTDLYKEKLKKTVEFANTAKQTITLFVSVFLKSSIDYADKLLILPLMNSEAVTIYYSSAIASKIFSLLFTSLSNVILSYIVKMRNLTKKTINKVFTILVPLSIVAYVLTYILSIPVLKVLYPGWAEKSIELIPYTTATAIVSSMTSIINPFIMKFKHFKWQVYINLVTFVTYIFSIIILQKYYDLIGVSVGVLVANFLKLVMMVIVLYRGKNNEQA